MRNHWRRDALLGEDASRSRNANLLANVALLRNTRLALLAEHHPDQPLPELLEQFHSRPRRCLDLLNSRILFITKDPDRTPGIRLPVPWFVRLLVRTRCKI